MKINKYPDGTSYVEVVSGEGTEWTPFRINSYEDLWHLNQFVNACNYYGGGAPRIIIPNLIDAQADRRFAKDQSQGLKLVCQFLNNMNASFKVFHPHNAEVVEALMDSVKIIDNTNFIERVLIKLNAKATTTNNGKEWENLILMSSDAGGFKPLMKLCDQLNWKGETYSASKARTKDGMKQLIDRQDFEGKDILIIDDICVKGGTFKGLAKLLKERNCGKLYLAVSHMTVQQLGPNPVTNYFDKVFITNSKYDEYDTYEETLDNLEIIKLF